MSVKTNIANGLKKFRKQSGLTTDEVGAAIDKSGKTIYAWEIGRGQPDGDELLVLCKLFGVHLKDFYGDEYEDIISDNESVDDLSETELMLLQQFRKCDDFQKASLLATIHDVAGDGQSLFTSMKMHTNSGKTFSTYDLVTLDKESMDSGESLTIELNDALYRAADSE